MKRNWGLLIIALVMALVLALLVVMIVQASPAPAPASTPADHAAADPNGGGGEGEDDMNKQYYSLTISDDAALAEIASDITGEQCRQLLAEIRQALLALFFERQASIAAVHSEYTQRHQRLSDKWRTVHDCYVELSDRSGHSGHSKDHGGGDDGLLLQV